MLPTVCAEPPVALEKPRTDHEVRELTRQVVMVLKELGWAPTTAIPGSFTFPDHAQKPSLVKIGFKPDLYDGSKPWADYKLHFEAVVQANNWDYRAAGLALAASLRGSAQCVLEESPGWDYRALVDSLETEFGDSNRAQIYEMQLRRRVQGSHEDFSAFARAVKMLARKAYPKAGAEVIGIAALGQFQEGLCNERVREMVIFGAPLTLRAAVELAIRADVALTQARIIPQQPRQCRQLEQQQEPQRMPVRIAMRDRMVCFRCNGHGHGVRDCPTRIMRCLRCDAPGHLARNCPTRLGSENGSKSPILSLGSTNQLEKEPSSRVQESFKDGRQGLLEILSENSSVEKVLTEIVLDTTEDVLPCGCSVFIRIEIYSVLEQNQISFRVELEIVRLENYGLTLHT
ncbi:hypothetical protein GE061_001686 [Apolygus lucorum]|uniref:CCHC-type domain-containing protein n=1 Tax=Apolygus lucorum TaxID=248454 RepID=A0A8S9Y7S2_APOLU|nr:hypothetical protein GE061_001686 [Apolygus lucorum]